jgi:hypothetical protein
MKKLFILSALLLSSCITTLSFGGLNTVGSSATFILKPGESTTTSGCLGANMTYYAASSDKSVCVVSSKVEQNTEYCNNGNPRYVVTVTGVSTGNAEIYTFADNASNGTYTVEVKDSSTSPYTLVPCYQFYNTINGDHFYTTEESAIEALTVTYPQWGYVYEGIAYYVYKKN